MHGKLRLMAVGEYMLLTLHPCFPGKGLILCKTNDVSYPTNSLRCMCVGQSMHALCTPSVCIVFRKQVKRPSICMVHIQS